MVIGFTQSPALPVKLAIELHQKLTEHNMSKEKVDVVNIRIGLSSGTVLIVKDILDRDNYWGEGIINARRVMDIGTDRHILIDSHLATDLRKSSDYFKSIIHPLGRYPFKHGQTGFVYSVYVDGFGNSNSPPVEPYKAKKSYTEKVSVASPSSQFQGHWISIDIVGYASDAYAASERINKIITLNKMISESETFKNRDPKSTILVPTGDGVIIGFKDSPEKPLKLALDLHKVLNSYNERVSDKEQIPIRIGLDSGPVYLIKDHGGKENVWGSGIITARRIMDLAGEMSILASARFANDVKRIKSDYKEILHPIGDYQLRHGESILIYSIYGDKFGTTATPRIHRKQESRVDEFQRFKNMFVFDYLSVQIEVLDPDTLLAHHTVLWNIRNISGSSTDRLFYSISGDVPRSFSDLNVTVKEEKGKELELVSLNVNKPYHKEFYAKLSKPIMPHGKSRSIKMKYDWEEPERYYDYRIGADCKKFTFMLTVPGGMPVNPKIVQLDMEKGKRKRVRAPAIVRYLRDRTEVEWSAMNLQAYSVYSFLW
jgi:class 3 adenylate cyclase